MAIITLTSDWGWKDHYAGAVKGAIISKIPDAQIIDITHSIRPFSSEEAAFILKNCYRNFPEGSVHIIGVNAVEEEKSPHLIVYCNKHYFIGADNGIFSMILDRAPDKIVALEIFYDTSNHLFPSKDRFAKAAAHLALKNPIETLGSNRSTLNQSRLAQPIVSDEFIRGEVIYIDNYENLITNISQELFELARRGRKAKIIYLRNTIERISNCYHDEPNGESVAIFGSHGNLEISLNQGNARGLLGGSINEKIIVEFFRK